MSNRLDQEREKRLQPKRIEYALEGLEKIGLKVIYTDENRIDFIFKGNVIQFYPYSGWHTGKGINDGRGWKKLVKQLMQ